MRRLIGILSLVTLWHAGTARAQLSTTPNEIGVAMGHVHLLVKNVEAEKKFWAALGGVPGNKITVQAAFKFPGMLILIRDKRQANGSPWPATEPLDGSEGSVVDHIAFRVPDLKASLEKWKAAGLNTRPGENSRQVFVFTPALIKVEVLEDKSLTIPITFDHIHFLVPQGSVAEIQAWYVKQFGATPGKDGKFASAKLPGAKLYFSRSTKPTVTTQGRALDHIGFEITGLGDFAKRLDANGVKVTEPYRAATGPNTFGAIRLLDPWGTYMELTEGERQY